MDILFCDWKDVGVVHVVATIQRHCGVHCSLFHCFLAKCFFFVKGHLYMNSFALFTPRVCGGVKRLVLSVCRLSSVCLSSVVCLSPQKLGYLAIYRVKRLINPTEPLIKF